MKKIKIKVNGKYVNIDKKQDLYKHLKKLKITIKKVAIELNQEIIDKKNITKIKIQKNDKIEIVHFIGGG